MSSDEPSVRYRLLRGWALQSRKAQHWVRRMENAIEASTGALLRWGLRGTEKEALSIDLYEASFQPQNDLDGLYAWETQWFQRRLPSPPASILIGAAGSGREARALRERGYDVHAFEPSPSAFRLCHRTLGPGRVDQASYQDLVAAVLHGKRTRLGLAREKEFDAILLGWGSFGHLLRHADRLDLLRACDRLAPRGPILLSIFQPPRTAGTQGPFYTSWAGFLAQPTVEELDQHATALNRKLIVSLRSPTSYATLVPNVP